MLLAINANNTNTKFAVFEGDRIIHVGKDYAGTVFRNCTTEAHLIFAGLAYVVEHDLHLYHYRVLSADAMLGDSSRQQERIAVELAL